MSAFYFEDVCTFKADLSIVGIVMSTWSEVDSDYNISQGGRCTYVHKDLHSDVLNAWFDHRRLSPGHVIIGFISRTFKGYCLVHESSLLLANRALAAGDCVKRSPSDAQSGTVMSTSLMCELQPLCSEAEYNRREHPTAHAFTPSCGPQARKSKSNSTGNPTQQANSSSCTSSAPSLLRVPAQELIHWHSYREEDFVIFEDWVGCVTCVYNEVTIRLSNGSVVVVEDPGELEEPYWIPGSKSRQLVERLDNAGFYNYRSTKRGPLGVHKPGTVPAEPCFPGQYVQTKKGNLRCGRWKFGAYDPSISPTGIVVDVRCVHLEVRWLYPNQSKPLKDHADPPSVLLETEEIESGQVLVYDRNRVPREPTAGQLTKASYAPDTGFGRRVRFRDPEGAALKYGAPNNKDTREPVSTSSHFRRLPRSATQGFDMNVLQVTSTTTRALVRWQNCTFTEEAAVNLYPYLNPDEHDVWPGDKVSYLPDEVHLKDVPIEIGTGLTRLSKIGVVQSVDAAERLASVRWFKNPRIELDEGKLWQVSGMTYGEIGDEVSTVSLYEIMVHDALKMEIADGVIILPNAAALSVGVESLKARLIAAGIERARGMMELAGGALGVLPVSTSSHAQAVPGSDTAVERTGFRNVDWCGEIVELCLDGQITVRLGAALDVQDIKIPPERALNFTQTDSDDDSYDSNEDSQTSSWTDELSMGDSRTGSGSDDMSVDVLEASIEYEGGENLDGAGDDVMWTTDEEDQEDSEMPTASKDGHKVSDASAVKPSPAPAASQSAPKPPVINPTTSSLPHAAIQLQAKAPSPAFRGLEGRAVSFSSFSSMPEQYAVLETPINDHHYAATMPNLSPQTMRRIIKENEIIRSSLPDGVFVRTWESRCDLLRVLIVGPHGTPYEFAPFVFDLQFGAQFPTLPPDAFFHSWTGNTGRINPNLYEDGMICLSLLGTWDADQRNEAWSSKNSTVLQIIVSFMGLVLVKEPYYNEAGFDILVGSEEARLPSALYNEKVQVMAKSFLKIALSSPPQGIDDIIRWLYLSSQPEGPRLLRRVVEDSRALLPDARASSGNNLATNPNSNGNSNSVSGSGQAKISTGALILLRRNLAWLSDYLAKDEDET